MYKVFIDGAHGTTGLRINEYLAGRSDIKILEIDPEKDLCTLVTCTPYGVNSHRLLVRGTRIEVPEIPAENLQQTVSGDFDARWLYGLLLIPVLGCIILMKRKRGIK